MKKKCLYCYEPLDLSETDYHPKCSKLFFGSQVPPNLDVNLSDIEKLALNILGRSTSITGVQPKLSVDVKKKEPLRLTIVGLWGKYILKPPHNDYPQMPENEDLTMKLAEHIGIKTAKHTLIRLKSGELAYISKRFDRTTKEKLHVEDFAQLLEVLTERKYHGTIEQIGKGILKYSSFPGYDLINLFEIILFSFIVGNADMHLKNFSLIRDEHDDIKVSPVYDLISTKLLIPNDPEESALSINGKKNKLTRKDFDYLADKFGFQTKTRNSIYEKFYNALSKWINTIDKSFLPDDYKSAYSELIIERLEKLEINKK